MGLLYRASSHLDLFGTIFLTQLKGIKVRFHAPPMSVLGVIGRLSLSAKTMVEFRKTRGLTLASASNRLCPPTYQAGLALFLSQDEGLKALMPRTSLECEQPHLVNEWKPILYWFNWPHNIETLRLVIPKKDA